MESKKWFKSKTIIAGIISILVVAYGAVASGLATQCGVPESFCIELPAIPDWIFAILGALGIYGRTSANTVIK